MSCPRFVALELLASGNRGKQNDAVAFERSIFSKNHDYNI